MRKFSLKSNLTGKKITKRKSSPTQNAISPSQAGKKTIQEIYSGKPTEKVVKKIRNTKKLTLDRKSSTKTICPGTKKSKHLKTKTYQNGLPLNSNRSDPDFQRKSLEKGRAGSVLEYCQKNYFKPSKKPSKRSPKSDFLITLKTRRGKIFDLIKTRLKCSKPRPISSRRTSKDTKKSLKSNRSNSLGKAYYAYEFKPDEKYEKISFQHPVSCREGYYESPDFAYKSQLEPCKTQKTGQKFLSLLNTEEFCSPNDLQNPTFDPKNIKKTFLIQNTDTKTVASDPVKFNFPLSTLTLKTNKEKIIENFTRNHAAKVIQRNFRRFLQTLHNKTKVQDIAKEQLDWKEAQILTLEYLKQKELEDLQFLSGLLGRNSPLEKLLFKTVQDRYENFSKFFKEDLDEEKLKIVSEKVEIIEKGNERKESVSKIILENNMNSSLSKAQIENLVKNNESAVIRVIPEENKVVEKESNENEVESKGLGCNFEHLRIQETENFDPVLLSPIFPETMNFPDLSSLIIEEDKEERGFSVPEPSDKHRFEDFSLESLISATTPQGKTQVPLLNIECMPVTEDILISDKRIETHPLFIEDFLNQIFKDIENSDLGMVKECASKDPLVELEKIHNDFNEFDDKFIYEPILNIEFILFNHFRASENLTLYSTDRQLIEADKIHKKMILAAADEILQYFRPYGIKGKPMPWSSESRSLSKDKTSTDDILQGFILYMLELASCQIGKIPTENMILLDGNLDEIALSESRKESLEYTLKKDILESDWIWTDIEYEETQTKLDLSDIILSCLCEELIHLI